MDRRTFSRNFAGGVLGATALARNSLAGAPPAVVGGEESDVPFKLSVMLWTVFQKLPFEERLEKVAEAGYKNVELVGEYHGWSEEDFRKANRRRHELGLTFDTTAGLKHGVGNPAARDAFLADLRQELKTMEKIACPAVIVMSGDGVSNLSRQAQHESCGESLKRAAEIVDGKSR